MKPKKPLRKYGFRGWDSQYNGTDFLVLTAFFPDCKPKTIEEIMETTDFTYEPVYTSLKALSENNLVSRDKVGKTNVFRINTEDPRASMAYSQYNFFRIADVAKECPIVYRILKEAAEKSRPCMLILYGSYARLEATKDSDMDVLIVDDPLNEVMKKTSPDYTRLFHALEMEYNYKINQTVMKYFEFTDLKNANPTFWETLKNEGVIVEGWDRAYNIYYK